MFYLKFCVEGIFNSFKVPFFRTYQKTFLAPPKTNVIGMIANILNKNEKWYYETLKNKSINISVVIDSIEGRTKDLWSYKTFEKKNDMHGKSVIRRDKLYKSKYCIYCSFEDDKIYNEVYNGLKNPIGIPSLGLDDEMVRIFDIRGKDEFSLVENDEIRINSVFMDNGMEYKAFIKEDNKVLEFPTSNIVPLDYDVEFQNDSRGIRSPGLELKQVEFINFEIDIPKMKKYSDGENKVVFY